MTVAAIMPAAVAQAQKSATELTPVPAPPAAIARLETEYAEINDFAAFPAQITRGPGKFFLHLVNRRRVQKETLILRSTALPASQLAVLSQAVHLSDFTASPHISGLFDAPAGTYQVVSQASGKVLLTVTIHQ